MTYTNIALNNDLLNVITYDFVKENILPKVFPAAKAFEEIAKGMICSPVLDFAVGYYIPFDGSNLRVTADLLCHVGMKRKEAVEYAMLNIEHQASIKPMCEMIGLPGNDEEALWVVTTESGIYGAAAILSQRVRMEISNKFGDGKIAILPSSVHEVIVYRTEQLEEDLPNLKNMVYMINRSEVSPDDRLTDSVYTLSGGELIFA